MAIFTQTSDCLVTKIKSSRIAYLKGSSRYPSGERKLENRLLDSLMLYVIERMEDRYLETYKTWNNIAQLYEDKFMNFELYNDTYKSFWFTIKTKR